MSDRQCPLCGQEVIRTDAERSMQACTECARRLGVIPMPPSRRPPRPCARCDGRQFVRVIPREHSSARSGEVNAQISAPMYVTHVPEVHHGWILHHAKEVAIESAGVGLLEAHICRGCGAVEWTCIDVENIPIHPHLMTELVDVQGEGPYR